MRGGFLSLVLFLLSSAIAVLTPSYGALSLGAAILLDHGMCRGIDPHSLEPVERTREFASNDPAAYSWVKVGPIFDLHTLLWKWYSPQGLYGQEGPITIGEKGRTFPRWAHAARLDIAGHPPSGLPGRWKVEVYFDGELLVIEEFTIGVGVSVPTADYGDAPDGLPCGYSEDPAEDVIGRFPTCYHTENSRVGDPGAHAVTVGEEALGLPALTSAERGAEDENDPDLTPNFIDDDLDDGLWVELSPDGGIRVVVRIGLAPTAPPGIRYLNAVWDLNRDGEWKGTPEGEEWIVKNLAVDIDPGKEKIVEIPIPLEADWMEVLAHPRWLRLVLSREPIDEGRFAAVGGWDGSGRFEAGEVEDYKLGAVRISDIVWEVRRAFHLAWAMAQAQAERLSLTWEAVHKRCLEIERLHKQALEISEETAKARAQAEENVAELKRLHTRLRATAQQAQSMIVRLPCAVVRASASAAIEASLEAVATALAVAEAAAQAAAEASARALAWANAIAEALATARASADALAVAKAAAEARAQALAVSWADARAWAEVTLTVVSTGGMTMAQALPVAWVQANGWATTWVQSQAAVEAWTSVYTHVEATAAAWTRAKAAVVAAAEAQAAAEASATAVAHTLANVRATMQVVTQIATTVDIATLPCWCPKQPPAPAFFSLEGLSVTPPQPGVGEEAAISALVRNTGEQSDTKEVRLYVDGVLVAKVSLHLAPGETREVPFSYVFTKAGSHTIEVETADDMRSARLTVVERGVAFFSIAELTVSPEEPQVGEEVVIQTIIKNTGSARGTGDVRFYVDGGLEDETSLSLAPGESREVIFYYTFESPGLYEVEIETSDDADFMLVTVAEAGRPYFRITELSVSPEEPEVGAEVVIQAVIENTGTAAGAEDIKLFIDGRFVDSQTLALEAGETDVIEFVYTFTDPGTYVVELETEHESTSMTVEVGEPPAPPVIVEVEVPESVAGHLEDDWFRFTIEAVIYFEDPNADIVRLHVEAWHSEMGYVGDTWVDPGIEGEESGSFRDTTDIVVPAEVEWCEGWWILAYTLYDSQGNESNTYEVEIFIEGCVG